jgi:hypothetical protein
MAEIAHRSRRDQPISCRLATSATASGERELVLPHHAARVRIEGPNEVIGLDGGAALVRGPFESDHGPDQPRDGPGRFSFAAGRQIQLAFPQKASGLSIIDPQKEFRETFPAYGAPTADPAGKDPSGRLA